MQLWISIATVQEFENPQQFPGGTVAGSDGLSMVTGECVHRLLAPLPWSRSILERLLRHHDKLGSPVGSDCGDERVF